MASFGGHDAMFLILSQITLNATRPDPISLGLSLPVRFSRIFELLFSPPSPVKEEGRAKNHNNRQVGGTIENCNSWGGHDQKSQPQGGDGGERPKTAPRGGVVGKEAKCFFATTQNVNKLSPPGMKISF